MYDYKNFSTLYVSQANGDNGANGLSPTFDSEGNAPLKTLDGALALAKRLRAHGVERPLTIALTDDYYVTSPIEISGIERLTVESYGKRRRIIGGVRIDGWREDIFNGVKCLSAGLPRELSGVAFTDLFVNGQRADVTRFPKSGTLRVKDTDSVFKETAPDSKQLFCPSKRFTVYPEDLSGISNVKDSIINFYHYWVDEHSSIESYDESSGELTLSYKTRFTSTALYDPPFLGAASSIKYYLTGVPNTFSEMGEWYLDRCANTVYYIPRDGERAESIEAFAPICDKLFEIEANDITVRNLELTVTKGDYGSRVHFDVAKNDWVTEGDERFGSDIQSVCWAPGAVTVKSAERFRMSNCSLHGLGIHALELLKGVRGARIENNEIYDICAGGIRIAGGRVGCSSFEITSDIVIRRNSIHHCGARYKAGCGVLLMDASNNEISENEIHDLSYSGISAGWVWGYAESATYGNVIKGNHIYNIGDGSLSDMGGIYTLGRQQGTVISENRIHDVNSRDYGAWGIYLDEGSSFITVESNVVYKTKTSSFHMHYGSNNVVRNNIFYGEGASNIRTTRDEPHERLVFENNILITDGFAVYSPHAEVENGIGASRNIIFVTGGKEPIISKHEDGRTNTKGDWCERMKRDEGSIFEDPMIPGLSEYDFTLAPDSPALPLGFKPLPESVAKPK